MKRHKHNPLDCLPHPKRRGEWVELKFMAEAAGRGLTVLKPYGDSSRFDCVVKSGSSLLKVQVKSVSTLRNYSYRCTLKSGRRYVPYSSHEIDFVVVYVVPCDTWYIIPARNAVGKKIIGLFPHHPSRGRYEKYREAWHLLLVPPPARRR